MWIPAYVIKSRGNQGVTQPGLPQKKAFVFDLESQDNGYTSAFSIRRVKRGNYRLIPILEKTVSLHHTLYRKLTILIPTLPEVPEYAKSQVPGFMDLNLDLLSCSDEIITVALSRYYEHNEDLIPDPDMVVRIEYERGNCGSVDLSRHVYLPRGLPGRETL